MLHFLMLTVKERRVSESFGQSRMRWTRVRFVLVSMKLEISSVSLRIYRKRSIIILLQ